MRDLVASKSKRGAITFETVRETRPNPFVGPPDALRISYGEMKQYRSWPALTLQPAYYAAHAQNCINASRSFTMFLQITQSIKEFMASRRNWNISSSTCMI